MAADIFGLAQLLRSAARVLVQMPSTWTQAQQELFVQATLQRANELGQRRIRARFREGLLRGASGGGLSLDLANQMINPELVEALQRDSPIWQQYAGMTQSLSDRVNRQVAAAHLEPGGFDRDKLVKAIRRETGIGARRARTIARTETNALRTEGNLRAFERRNPAGTWRYRWGGPPVTEPRISDSCIWVIEQIPEQGLPLGDLKELVQVARRTFHPNLRATNRTQVHPNERHSPQKVRDSSGPPTQNQSTGFVDQLENQRLRAQRLKVSRMVAACC